MANDPQGHFPLGGIFRAERHFLLFKDQLAESGRQKTKENIIPRGKFRLVENGPYTDSLTSKNPRIITYKILHESSVAPFPANKSARARADYWCLSMACTWPFRIDYTLISKLTIWLHLLEFCRFRGIKFYNACALIICHYEEIFADYKLKWSHSVYFQTAKYIKHKICSVPRSSAATEYPTAFSSNFVRMPERPSFANSEHLWWNGWLMSLMSNCRWTDIRSLMNNFIKTSLA